MGKWLVGALNSVHLGYARRLRGETRLCSDGLPAGDLPTGAGARLKKSSDRPRRLRASFRCLLNGSGETLPGCHIRRVEN